MRGVSGSFTVRLLDTERLASGDFNFGLVANATSAADLSMQETCVLLRYGVCEHVLFAICRNFRDIFSKSTTDDQPDF